LGFFVGFGFVGVWVGWGVVGLVWVGDADACAIDGIGCHVGNTYKHFGRDAASIQAGSTEPSAVVNQGDRPAVEFGADQRIA
jgi:hypothetical protein